MNRDGLIWFGYAARVLLFVAREGKGRVNCSCVLCQKWGLPVWIDAKSGLDNVRGYSGRDARRQVGQREKRGNTDSFESIEKSLKREHAKCFNRSHGQGKGRGR